MNAPDNEYRVLDIEFWKTRCTSLEQQIHVLQQRNSSLSRENEEKCLENARLMRVIQNIENKIINFCQTERKPSEDSKRDSYDFFYTFPEEVWPFILVYINKSTDLLNLCDASPLLGSVILNKDKPVWLYDQLFPKIFKWLTKKEVLTCRLVCNKWNQTIENYRDSCANSPSATAQQLGGQTLQSYRLSQDAPSIWKTKLQPLDIYNTAQLRKFAIEAKLHQKTCGRNLLFSRSLKLGLDQDNDDNDNHDVDAFWETALVFLRNSGHDIWHIELYNDGLEDDAAAFYGLLQQLLCYLPNLKTLRLICEFENRFAQNELIDRLGSWSLPCLPNLETFHLLHSMPFQMTSVFMLGYARQLRKLVLSVSILQHVNEEHLCGFVNLSELVLRDCVKDPSEFQLILQKLEKFECPNLEKLRLFRSYSEEEVISVKYVCDLLQKFPRLRALDTYRMIVVIKPEETKESIPNAYSIRSLKIKCHHSLSADFLEKLPFLEELFIRIAAPDFAESLDQWKIYESWVWKMLPKLKQIVCESFDEEAGSYKRFTREKYEYLLKQQAKDENDNEVQN